MNTRVAIIRLGNVTVRGLWFGLLFALSVAASAQGPVTVCIDPGHPTVEDQGTRGKRALELQVNWLIARQLRLALMKDGLRVVLTKREENMILSNRRRAEIATWAKANLLVRLHCDAGQGSGFTVYYPGAQGRAADGTIGPSKSVIASSKKAATLFHDEMAKSLAGSLSDLGLKTDAQSLVGSRQGALTGSIFSTVPTLLIEMCVLTNPKDENFILSKVGRAKMVTALEKGVLASLHRSLD